MLDELPIWDDGENGGAPWKGSDYIMSMGAETAIEPDPLLAGFYSVNDAVRLLGVASAGKLRGWLNGWPNSRQDAIVRRDFKGTSTVSFLDLMELRFIEYFRGQGVSMNTLRRAAEMARKDWNVQHPFALSDAHYHTDRRNIIARAADELGDAVTWNLATGQYLIWEMIERSIAKGVVFNPKSYLASLWYPRKGDFPSVVLDPARAFGKPIIENAGVPTRALFDNWKAEAGDVVKVARWFQVEPAQVEAAVGFEVELSS